ncbi:probable ADP-ribosylation factor GTPase-activating protein AGD14 isoform X2 [Alnus glutinosa]|uniref:probable ADP-ribosylation factor GTPase-activating protein AGD14 isoform X2 n=1 Tax=Alnus glutinosa TaxID=3517 RepID=UPI002D79D4CF|nr:probable ADP-ribosylation factor GTPase-activating protein AGD14 isoform X2 [Alnus glutinosa]
MGSKREEERNEKIIRGLMKLPPNRRCINCNSLGPQYVCPNFWTFICTTCGGIHREFTHRVKSVSMAKFTSQEVEALQNGGNQRARDTYLKDWDLQRQRLPDSSKVDKIREFIKNVYVERRYVGGKTSDKPPRDVQNLSISEVETRRASSYHSYSQSPPYDYQYEDRRYGKQAGALSRKPGSDRGRYEGKMSSLVYSPGRLSEKMYEDRFANEGSVSRISDYSVSSAGDPFRSNAGSPNFHKDVGFSSPPIQPSRGSLSEDSWFQAINASSEAHAKRDADGIPHPQRIASSGSFGSMDSNSLSYKSYNPGGLTDVVSELEQPAGTLQDKAYMFTQSSVSESSGNLDLFTAPLVSEPESSTASPLDLNRILAASSAPSLDLFQPSVISPALSVNLYQPPQTSTSSSLDFFAEISLQQPATTLDKEPTQLSVPENEGWATFDTPQATLASIPHAGNPTPERVPSSDLGSLEKFDKFSSLNTNMHWPSFQSDSFHGSSSTMSNPWHDGLHNVQPRTQAWNAFEDSTGNLSLEGNKQVIYGLSQGEMKSHAMDHKSTNPFDLPNDSDFEQSNMFLDMSPLDAALPNAQLPSTFHGGVSQPWFPQNTGTPYIPAVGQGGLTYMAGQTPSSQMANVSSQGPVASIGGNPFA